VAPIVVYVIAHRVCIELQRGERVVRDRKRAEEEAATAAAGSR
jgi:hypothetical protein